MRWKIQQEEKFKEPNILQRRIRNYPVHSTRGTAPCAVGALSAPFRNTLPAPPGLGCATKQCNQSTPRRFNFTPFHHHVFFSETKSSKKKIENTILYQTNDSTRNRSTSRPGGHGWPKRFDNRIFQGRRFEPSAGAFSRSVRVSDRSSAARSGKTDPPRRLRCRTTRRLDVGRLRVRCSCASRI
ncbi:unnamed protein product [Nesidiocoris tenuis]|uniref:Uncharacterized protein n=1 Tax=Nesidiocoris tenuis TaxID=355587 RepID=A0A6H5GWJ9_9HEMI|nr:unnamed protein product [Nesidiocoris tenuis]